MKLIKNSILLAALLGLGLGTFSGCSDEDNDERDVPAVWNVVSQMYEKLEHKKDCREVQNYLDTSEVREPQVNLAALTEACKEYRDRRDNDNKGRYESLALDKTNSGYYQSAFILMDKIYDDIVLNCTTSAGAGRVPTVDSASVKGTFDALMGPGKGNCEAFVNDAKTFVDKRGI